MIQFVVLTFCELSDGVFCEIQRSGACTALLCSSFFTKKGIEGVSRGWSGLLLSSVFWHLERVDAKEKVESRRVQIGLRYPPLGFCLAFGGSRQGKQRLGYGRLPVRLSSVTELQHFQCNVGGYMRANSNK